MLILTSSIELWAVLTVEWPRAGSTLGDAIKCGSRYRRMILKL